MVCQIKRIKGDEGPLNFYVEYNIISLDLVSFYECKVKKTSGLEHNY